MNNYAVFITGTAFEDLEKIARYIKYELKEPLTAINIIAEIKKGIFSLDNMPCRHNLVRDKNLAHMGYRRLFVGNYTVFYIVLENKPVVNIVRVLYSRRNWEELL
jgi:toxin ParE1/3/4